VTRSEKIAKARELSAKGWNNREIGERLGVSTSAAWKWLHPDAVREINRRDNARRGPEKRAWEDRARATCSECGTKLGVGSAMPSKAAERCVNCIRDAARSRIVRFIELREAGKTNRQIASAERISEHAVAMLFYKAYRYGLVVPAPPYWSRGTEVAA
jgi:hypothetical protein